MDQAYDSATYKLAHFNQVRIFRFCDIQTTVQPRVVSDNVRRLVADHLERAVGPDDQLGLGGVPVHTAQLFLGRLRVTLELTYSDWFVEQSVV